MLPQELFADEGISEQERAVLFDIQRLFCAFWAEISNFRFALDLYAHFERDAEAALWRMMEIFPPTDKAGVLRQEYVERNAIRSRFKYFQDVAVRDAGMGIWHIGKILVLIAEELNKCPVLSTHIDKNRRKLEWNLFDKSRFPRWEGIRHAIAHKAEFYLTSNAIASHSIIGPMQHGHLRADHPSSRVCFHGCEGRVFGASYNRGDGAVVVSFELTEASLNKLIATYDGYENVLKSAAASYLSSVTTYG